MPVCSNGRQYPGQMGAYSERNGSAECELGMCCARFIDSLGGVFYFFKDSYNLLKAAFPPSFPTFQPNP